MKDSYFKKVNEKMIDILDSSDLSEKEVRVKKNKLNEKLENMININKIDNHYVSLAHEIKSYEFLKHYGNLKMARDCNSEKGPDFKLERYRIECVCCSSGDTDKNGLEDYRINENRKSIVNDYNKLLEILLPRITQELVNKSKKIKSYINSRIVKEDEPCIIFISLGEIAQDFLGDKYGFDLLNVLMGKSHLNLIINQKTNKVIGSYYSHVEKIKKQNGSLIDANFFLEKKNRHISGILFTDAYIYDLYDKNNTFLFLNPYATNKIKVKDFNDLIYWKENKDMEYVPRYKGKNIWYRFKNNFF